MHLQEEAARCLLCSDAPCSKACKNGDPARAVRAVRFGNESLAHEWFKGCSEADLEAAEKACVHYDRPIRLREMAGMLPEAAPRKDLPGLEIDFCGIRCENPFFLASSAVCTNYDMVSRAFEAGWGGVFYKTICLKEIREVSPRFDAMHSAGTGDFYSFRNMEQLSENPPEVDFEILSRLKKNYPSKIVVASIMGQTEEEWIELAKMAEEAGCRCGGAQLLLPADASDRHGQRRRPEPRTRALLHGLCQAEREDSRHPQDDSEHYSNQPAGHGVIFRGCRRNLRHQHDQERDYGHPLRGKWTEDGLRTLR